MIGEQRGVLVESEEEYQRLLQAAGFRLERIIPTHSPFSVIEATRV